MTALDVFPVAVSALGWCLVHFLWQASAVGAIYALARGLLPRGNPRYLAAMLAMAALALIPAATAWHELRLLAVPVDLGGMVVTGSATALAPTAPPPAWASVLDAALPWLVLAWAAGVGVLGVRVFRQWRGLRAMLKAAESLPTWQARARQFADRLGLRRVVPVLASVRIATPTLVGWIRPAVVLPLAVLAKMPAAQIDLVLAHELAHLRRFDHLANLFQVALETLFFYHPVVHWISRDARNERELCCDVLALRVTGGERRDFVAALANLEEFRADHADLALAASGGVLVERAWFIAGAAPKHRRQLRGNATLTLAIAVVLGLGWLWWRDAMWQQRVASLVNANNASVMRFVAQDVRVPGLLPMALAPAATRLAPVPYAKAATRQGDGATMPLAPIRVAAVVNPALDLDFARQRLAPVTALVVPALSQEAAATDVAAMAAPRPLHTVRPVYPSQALLTGVQGEAVVEFALDAAGIPHELEVVGSGAGPFGAAALRALAGWRFAPPAVPGRRYRQAFTFSLDGDAAAAAQACFVTTGTHICRHVPGTDDPGVQVLRPNR